MHTRMNILQVFQVPFRHDYVARLLFVIFWMTKRRQYTNVISSLMLRLCQNKYSSSRARSRKPDGYMSSQSCFSAKYFRIA